MEPTSLDKWLGVIDKTRDLFQHHIPAESLPNAIFLALVLSAIGILLGVFGAHFAKAILSVILGGLGYAVGAKIAANYGQPVLIGGLVGFALLAAIGFFLHRLWVGMAVGLVASMLALSWYGHDAILTEYHGYVFEQPAILGGTTTFTIPNAEAESQGVLQRAWAQTRGFYDHLSASQPATSRKAIGILVLCSFAGFLFGTCCTRWALILTSAAVGTMVFGAGLITFAERFVSAGWERRLMDHPYGTLSFIGICFILSALIQLRMTKPQAAVENIEE